MPAISLAGSSNTLRSRKAGVERSINWFPVPIDGVGKGGAGAYLKQCPGLVDTGSIYLSIRGATAARGVTYVVSSSFFGRLESDGSLTTLGGLLTAKGFVSITANTTQIAIVDGPNLYVYGLDDSSWFVNPANFRTSSYVDTLDGYGIFADAETAQMYISASQDFTSLDPLDFVTAEGANGSIVSFLVKHREILVLKETSGEHWYDSGASDFPLSRNMSGSIEVGCSAGRTLQKIGGTAFWLGQDEKGGSVVFGMAGYQPSKVSSRALEEALQGVADVSESFAWTYQQEGFSFYVLTVPGLSTTWVYEVGSGAWHERAEFTDSWLTGNVTPIDGYWTPWRPAGHVYAQGKHFVWATDGRLYTIDPTVNTYAGRPLVRDRTSPHYSLAENVRRRVGSLQIDCDVGQVLDGSANPQMMLRYSDDGGNSWGSWRYLTLGKVGEYQARARAVMLGSARDRVWQFRVVDDVRCNVLSAVVDEV